VPVPALRWGPSRSDSSGVAHLFAFLGVSALVIATPGQDTALTIRNTLVGGRRAGVLTAVGVSAGQAVWALAAAAGVAALLRASEPAFLAVRLVGGAYLVYLGAQALSSAVRRRSVVHAARSSRRGLAPLRQGVISNLGNPKMAVFFTSLLPQFGSSFPALLALGLVFCSLTLAWLSGYAVAVAKAGDFLLRLRIRRTLDGLTGAVLVGLGLRLAAER
jgi:threonine/homoserine/homoserine lactone efflux protein